MFIRETANRGFVLLLVLVVMVALSAIVGALILSLTTDFRNAGAVSNDTKAFWLAEAGIADAIKRLKNNEINVGDGSTNNTAIKNVSLGDGTYSVTIARSGQEYMMTSVGTVAGQSRTLTQTQTLGATAYPAAFNYAAFGSNAAGTGLQLGGNTGEKIRISGGIHFDRPNFTNDTIRIFDPVIGGPFYTDQVTCSSGLFGRPFPPAVCSQRYPAVHVPAPVPTYPPFNSASYNATLAVAESVPRLNLRNPTATINLQGQTLYYKDVLLNAQVKIIGPGTIVATNSMYLAGDKITLSGSNVNFISKSLLTVQKSLINRDSVARHNDIYFSKTGISLTSGKTYLGAFLAPEGSVNLSQASVYGLIYAKATSVSNSSICGSMVANNLGAIMGNTNLTFEKACLPTVVPPGFSSSGEGFSKKSNSWKEL